MKNNSLGQTCCLGQASIVGMEWGTQGEAVGGATPEVQGILSCLCVQEAHVWSQWKTLLLHAALLREAGTDSQTNDKLVLSRERRAL